MGYIQDNLMPSEKIQYSARVHPAVFLPAIIAFLASIAGYIYFYLALKSQNDESLLPLAVFVCSFVAFFFLWSILLSLQALIIKLTTEFAITNQRVIGKTGFIRRHTIEILLTKVENVAVRQNIPGRLFNFGTVTVTGTGGTSESFKVIDKPIVMRKKINEIIEQ